MIQETEEKALVSQALEARKLAYDCGWTQIPWR